MVAVMSVLKTKRAYRCRQRQGFTKDDNDTEEKVAVIDSKLAKKCLTIMR